MDVLSPLKTIFGALGRIMGFTINLNGFVFSIGQMVVGLIVIGLSIVLLRKLFDRE